MTDYLMAKFFPFFSSRTDTEGPAAGSPSESSMPHDHPETNDKAVAFNDRAEDWVEVLYGDECVQHESLKRLLEFHMSRLQSQKGNHEPYVVLNSQASRNTKTGRILDDLRKKERIAKETYTKRKGPHH
ncbi:hypothetical protein MP638_007500 [Amoeboaphelidium occidentale]|nr:hypothetical protein MP638_007500 [Amoeboaphelidium occidentale]